MSALNNRFLIRLLIIKPPFKPDIKGKGKARSKPVKKARTRKPKRKSGRGFIVNSDGETDSDFNIDTDSNATSESDDESDGSIIDRKGKGRALSFSPMPEYIKSRAQLEKEENMKIDYEHAEPSTKIKMIIELVEDWRTNVSNHRLWCFIFRAWADETLHLAIHQCSSRTRKSSSFRNSSLLSTSLRSSFVKVSLSLSILRLSANASRWCFLP